VGPSGEATAAEVRVPSAFARLADPEPSLGVRTFAFTPEETVRLLRADQRISGRSRLALVLPGGGVKAAYQSRVAEALYRDGFLKNAGAGIVASGAGPEPRRRPLEVDTVIGTSGGALLGFFVARLGEHGPWNLSCLLWSKSEACRADDELGFLDSSDIFPRIDLLRYLSLVVVFFVLSLLLTLFGLRRGARLAPERDVAPPAARPALRLRWGLLAVGVLALIPVLVRLANGERVVEHVPPIQGLLFFALVLLVVAADHCLVLAEEPPRRVRGRRWIGMTLILAGLAAVALPVALLSEASGSGTVSSGRVTWLTASTAVEAPLGGLLVSLGALALLLGQIVALTAWSPHYRVARPGAFLRAIALALFHALAVLGVVWIASRTFGDSASFFELTSAYWLWLLTTAVTVGLVLIVWGWWGTRPRRLVAAVRTGLEYLCSPHPNGRLVRRRYARVLVVGAGALVWWNLVLAPAAYGNGEAFRYLAAVAERFDRSYGEVYPDQSAYRLRARFLTPANALKDDGTRFFLFVPQEGACPSVAQRPGSGGTWQRYRVLVDEGPVAAERGCEPLDLRGGEKSALQDQEYLRSVVFASGSPFPVFPAHRVRRGEAAAEPLVDGGYTNNLPLDPALALGLEQVLVLQSSHPYPVAPGPAPAGLQVLAGVPGPLVKQLLRLPGYLYGRSQQLDRRSRGALFVASLAPSADELDWPFLTDFRSRRVRQMLTTAERDLGRRIGSVESWGPPSFQASVMLRGTANGAPAK
ncbi:MAG TPA: hypothetical protein VHQ65_04240, partial [Thermoanaerobaculia bacterium]|nr:hypothetical protein [Thermoanaerobaculia bacterium]